MARIVADPRFVGSERRRQFLRFAVEETLAGREDRIKAYTIAVEVFGRDDTFDPQSDPIVRIEAGRLRRSLEQYYAGPGRGDEIRIDIPKGSYVPVFSWRTNGESVAEAAQELPASGPRPSNKRLLSAGALTLAALVLLTVTWFRSAASPDVQQRGPALIVLPFENLAGGRADDAFTAGLTEELIWNLMRFGELRLYSSHGSFLEQPSADPVELGERLDVGYVVKGSVRRASDRIRLTVHLVQADTGRHLWTETYERVLTPDNVLELQEQLAANLSGQLAQPYGIINEVSADLFRTQRPDTLFSYECVLRALEYRRTHSREQYGPARECLEEAVLRDPGYAMAWALLGSLQLDQYRYGYGEGAGDASVLDLALTTARKATELDGDSVVALLALSSIQFYRGEFAEAASIHERLLASHPNNPEVLAQVGWRTAFASKWDRGIALVGQAIERSILAPDWYHLIMALGHYRQNRYEAALVELGGSAASEWVWLPLVLAAAHGQLGSQDEARRALARAQVLDPDVVRDPRAAMATHRVPGPLIDQLIDGLVRAGLSTS